MLKLKKENFIKARDYVLAKYQRKSVGYRSMIHTEVHYADEITWGILPYVPWQYEK